MIIPLDGIELRNWRADDAHSLARHANNRRVWRNLRDHFPHPYTLDDANRWICYARDIAPHSNFAIAVRDEAVGGAGLSLREDVYRRSAEVGYWLGEAHWGRGIATRVVRAVADYAFDSFDVCRLWAEVFEWNAASMRVLEKCGFALEARLRKSVTKDGQTVDALLYALLREDRC